MESRMKPRVNSIYYYASRLKTLYLDYSCSDISSVSLHHRSDGYDTLRFEQDKHIIYGCEAPYEAEAHSYSLRCLEIEHTLPQSQARVPFHHVHPSSQWTGPRQPAAARSATRARS